MSDSENQPSSDQPFIGVPPLRANNWKYVLGFLAFLGVTGLVLSVLYGERPKKYEVLAKRTHPPTRSVYALVVSPLDSLTARATVNEIRSDVQTPDSSDINMVIGSTAIYKRFASSEEFCRVLEDAERTARPVELDKQAVLISQLCGILIKDTLPTRLILIGKLASTDFEIVKKQMNTSARIIVQRNSIFGPVEIDSFLDAPHSEAVEQFLSYFKRQGIVVRQRSLKNPSDSSTHAHGA